MIVSLLSRQMAKRLCKNCRYWGETAIPHYVQQGWGRCMRYDGDNWETASKFSSIGDWKDGTIETAPNFGCVLWESK
jgi:hypothetical protein